MDTHEKTDAACLPEKKFLAVRELLKIISDWQDAGDYEDTAALSAHLEKCRKAIEKLILIEGELGKTGRDPSAPVLFADPERIGEADEMLRQAKLLMNVDKERIKKIMAFYQKEAARLRSGKSGLTAYMKNGMPAHRERVDLRG